MDRPEKTHYLKTDTEYFQAHMRGEKSFEIRLNDRDYRVGDLVCLQEVIDGQPTGRLAPPAKITYIFHGGEFGLDHRYCVLQLKGEGTNRGSRKVNPWCADEVFPSIFY